MIGTFCKECGVPMKKVMHFELNGNSTFNECPKCHFRTKPKKLIIQAEREERGGKN